MVGDTFQALGLGEDAPADDAPALLFSYMPLNHVNATTGQFECGKEFDCASSRFDSCLVHRYCWPNCAGSTARALASFLQCYEGPYANTEALTDPARREPCMRRAGLDYAAVMGCAADAAQYGPFEDAINASRAPMYAALGPDPGTFPHIFIDGRHQSNNTWTFLLRTLCGMPAVASRASHAACATQRATLSFTVDGLTAASARAHAAALGDAVNLGVNLAASESALPIHWKTRVAPGDPPSYVNVRVSGSASLVAAADRQYDNSGTGTTRVRFDLSQVLSVFVPDLVKGCSPTAGNVTEYLEYALTTSGSPFGKQVANVRDVVVKVL